MQVNLSTAANLESGDVFIIFRNTLIVSFSDLLANTCTAGTVRQIALHRIWMQTGTTWSAPSTYCSRDCFGAAAIQRTASCCCAGGHAERPCTNQTFIGHDIILDMSPPHKHTQRTISRIRRSIMQVELLLPQADRQTLRRPNYEQTNCCFGKEIG